VVALAIVLGTVIAINSSLGYIDPDTGVFLTMALIIEDGYLPYTDFFEHKPPLVYLSILLVKNILKIVGQADSLQAVYIVWISVVYLLQSLLIISISKKWNIPWYLIAASVLSLYLSTWLWGIFTESLSVLLALGAFRLALNVADSVNPLTR